MTLEQRVRSMIEAIGAGGATCAGGAIKAMLRGIGAMVRESAHDPVALDKLAGAIDAHAPVAAHVIVTRLADPGGAAEPVADEPAKPPAAVVRVASVPSETSLGQAGGPAPGEVDAALARLRD